MVFNTPCLREPSTLWCRGGCTRVVKERSWIIIHQIFLLFTPQYQQHFASLYIYFQRRPLQELKYLNLPIWLLSGTFVAKHLHCARAAQEVLPCKGWGWGGNGQPLGSAATIGVALSSTTEAVDSWPHKQCSTLSFWGLLAMYRRLCFLRIHSDYFTLVLPVF